ncbi:E3 ubiquitin-protein ligase RNF14-like isoform X2 [Protopterus annectens]|uniref:E3 ubiquitin-protein ligase RNF14-like isoform X2 n=1 Tax=Protopterus annectens TaxID=7888 RepID=UPI001CFB3A07|nr:E3 ubiquitin-protein ligase RNF14-like isoform X2 [Protopterus annectens]
MSSEDIEAQEDELLALAGIYNEDEFNRTESSQGGEIRICLTLPPHFRVLVDGRNEQLEYIVEFLPPIILRFDLPVDYPSASAPAFTLHCKWLSESQVKQLVGEEAFSRYDHLLLQNGLSLMTDVVYCPRLSCQTAVLKEPDSEMAVCNSCFFAFCTKCNLTYHGVAPCHNEVAEELGSPVNENCESTDDSEGDYDEEIYRMVSRKKLAQRYQNEKWVKENAKVCPNCRSPVQKDGGCNKMTCGRCGSFFCWVCLAHLKQNPYDHFQDPDSPCSSQQL